MIDIKYVLKKRLSELEHQANQPITPGVMDSLERIFIQGRASELRHVLDLIEENDNGHC